VASLGLTKFVGREAELAQMNRALELAKTGRGQIVAVIAEHGVGKSRLFLEFKAHPAMSGCVLLEAFAVSHGKASAYLPFLDLLLGYFGIVPEDGPPTRRKKISSKLANLDPSLEESSRYVFGLLGLLETDDPLAQMDAEPRKRRTHEAIKRILVRQSLAQPLVLVFEDLHWIDEQTRDLLNFLADGIATARILLLVNYRPEFTHAWGNKSYYPSSGSISWTQQTLTGCWLCCSAKRLSCDRWRSSSPNARKAIRSSWRR
jgi:predicted ATPase